MAKEKEGGIEMEGNVVEALANTQFRVKLENGHIVPRTCRAGCARTSSASSPGDRVKVEISPDDLTRGRIIFRER